MSAELRQSVLIPLISCRSLGGKGRVPPTHARTNGHGGDGTTLCLVSQGPTDAEVQDEEH